MRYIYHIGSVGLALAMLSGCEQNSQSTHSTTLQEFTVMTVTPRDAELYIDYPATVRGQQNIEIRPKIDGYIATILVDEGAKVKKDQLLFRINNPQYEQEVLTAQAAIKRAVAGVNTAKMQIAKTEPLVKKEIISEYELQSAHLELEARQAELAQAKAALQNAQTNLGYTIIRSPADGVIGTLPYKIGSLVSSTSEQALTVLSDISNIHVYFSFSEKQFLELMNAPKEWAMDNALKRLPPAQLVLANGQVYAENGHIETTGGLINTGTGAITMRALFPNKAGTIRSGSSATLRIAHPVKDALIVPAKATYEVQGKKFVMILDSLDTAHSAEITVDALPVGDAFVVNSGLRSGDRVVTEDVGAIKDGDKIKPKNQVAIRVKR
ncbi:efflux RND transporter periplasmic adaptor subunit [Olivibacter sp. CPCC 100613]|uniref:efflux RND transporter periplasmic adaptor subunit n=1 Tax=Olivibacter sp. CPCC 100613 TaxID=3079931 RepID=UPI002FF4F47A